MISVKLSHARPGLVRLHVASVSACCLFCVTRRSRSDVHDSHTALRDLETLSTDFTGVTLSKDTFRRLY